MEDGLHCSESRVARKRLAVDSGSGWVSNIAHQICTILFRAWQKANARRMLRASHTRWPSSPAAAACTPACATLRVASMHWPALAMKLR